MAASTGYNDTFPTGPSGAQSNAFMNSGGGGVVEAVELDPSSGASFFNTDFKKHDDLKQMLDTNKDSLKLEAMKRIIGMVARGKDAGDLFPAVVKNVVSKNIEIKKLVYVYLTRYAEEQQDLALLSISTFQRALKDPNQLIRASALRVLSSIRVPVIVPIMMLSIRDSAVDMSPFVRKTAAHAIPKLYSLDPDQKEELVSVIEKLLGDRTTLVVGSAVMAFEEVCPERIELIHKNFRKLCNLLVDVEEWGQVVIVNMLSRYARTQFVDPNQGNELEEMREKEFYENSDDDDEDDDEAERKKREQKRPKMDQDHRLLLRSAKPLLQSRNASVVMATAQLYHHCAPKAEVQFIAKAMIRLLRSHKEVQAIVLNCIASMTSSRQRNNMFEPFLRNFFVSSSDPTHIKILKLEIITNMASQSNIGIILREFQSYITGHDKMCVAATIQAIGRCAATIDEVTDTCLNGLVHLLSNKDQAVVAESVVVIKKLLQTQTGDHKDIIIAMSNLVDKIEVPAARSAILWVLGEYSERVPKIAPDVLRKMAKTFTNEEPEVKMQVLNLAIKLSLTNPAQTKLLCQYVFNLAKYDQNYDIRDRARFMRVFVLTPPGQENNFLIKQARNIFLAKKPAPVIQSKFKEREVFQLGSLSHFLNAKATGYQALPDFPDAPPDSSVRNVEPPPVATNPWAPKSEKSISKKMKGIQTFYSDGESSSKIGEDSEESSSDSSSSSGSESSSSGSGSESESELESVPKVNGKVDRLKSELQKKSEIANDKDESSSGSSEESSSDSSSDPDDTPIVQNKKGKDKKPQTNLDLLLDFSDTPTMQTPMLTPSLGGFPDGSPNISNEKELVKEVPAHFIPTKSKELLNKMTTGGLQILYRYTRSPHLYSPKMVNAELTISNFGSDDLAVVEIGAKKLAPGMSLKEFPGIPSIPQNGSANVNIGIDFNDTTQAAKFDLIASGRCYTVSITPVVGELVRAVQIPENHFTKESSKLRGMNETVTKVKLPSVCANETAVKKTIYEASNVLQVPSSEEGLLKFAGKTLSTGSLLLLQAKLTGEELELTINCEKIVIGNMLAKELKQVLEKS